MPSGFFGTVLDSLSVNIPRHLWKLPWHRGRIRFDCRLTPDDRGYASYRMQSSSWWAPAELEIEDSGQPVDRLEGFDDLESALVLLTHPLQGFYYRRDGTLGSYSIWHDRLDPTLAHCKVVSFPLLDRLGLVPFAAQSHPHSILLQPEIEFSIYLPPKKSPIRPTCLPRTPGADPRAEVRFSVAGAHDVAPWRCAHRHSQGAGAKRGEKSSGPTDDLQRSCTENPTRRGNLKSDGFSPL